VGRLNLISVTFAVMNIGLGTDYAIHLCLRYRELKARGAANANALRVAVSDVGASLLPAAATTAVGFFAFVPTAYAGVSELGLIEGTGVFISLITSLTLLPALLTIFPLRQNGVAQHASLGRSRSSMSVNPCGWLKIRTTCKAVS
jgi:predicted RND superfamily exporter protein